MSDEHIFAEEILPVQSATAAGVERAIRWLILIIMALLGGELLWLLVIIPGLPLSRVEITGIPEMDKPLVLEKAGIGPRSSYLTVDSRRAERGIKTLYQIESVQVIKHFPNSVEIILKGRIAAAQSFAVIQGKVCPVLFDRQGLIFMIGPTGQHRDAFQSVPILSGVMDTEPVLGIRLSPLFHALLVNLELIHTSAPELLATISEIRINRKAFDVYDLILYPVHSRIRVHVGAELNEDMLRYVMLILNVCVSRGDKIEEIDFRTGIASYTIKEASSG
ncbi:MAG: FtsQ-type POTRA domain-containing protein [Treponema sp.]|jgi:cell division protein FtsQ|nr:FtsQ-type POTRA domain-containing protein [Treponema sp.]